MADCYLGEIRLFAGRWTPEDWHVCDGSLLSISTYQSLFAVLGVIYGGDGVTTFGIPDLRGRVPIGQGQGNGLTSRALAAMGGEEEVTLTPANLPVHSHTVTALNTAATTSNPSGALLAQTSSSCVFYTQMPGLATVQLDPRVITTTVGYPSAPTSHPNIMASLGLNYIIALTGIFPQRN